MPLSSTSSASLVIEEPTTSSSRPVDSVSAIVDGSSVDAVVVVSDLDSAEVKSSWASIRRSWAEGDSIWSV